MEDLGGVHFSKYCLLFIRRCSLEAAVVFAQSADDVALRGGQDLGDLAVHW